MKRRITLALLMLVTAGAFPNAAVQQAAPLKVFQDRLDGYIQMHRRLEGPLPPLMVTTDMDEVHRLMDALRARLKAERKGQPQGYLFTPGVVEQVRATVASSLTLEDIAATMEAIDEHTPAGMPPLRVSEALPEDAPFGLVPPRALQALPALPPELRYVVLSGALVIWDHHADLVVDIAPGVFDQATYRKSVKLNDN